MAELERRLKKLEHDRAELLALSKPQEMRVVQLDRIDFNAPELPVLVIAPGLLAQLRGDPIVDLRRKV